MTTDGLRTTPDTVDVDTTPDTVDVDAVTLGESMVTFLPTRPGRLADVPSFERGIGGAESNVACALAAAGHAVRWVSRVGTDGFGDHLLEAIGSHGVDVTSVRRDPARPTGVYFRTAGDRATDAHEVAYYRAGSAASAMTVGNVDVRAARAGRVLHLSGITAALSGDCLDLLRELTAPAPDRPLVSFDVNHRAGLWRDNEEPEVLLDLARGADVVFVGEDEAEEAWGVNGGPQAIRALLPEPHMLIVKQGAHGATLFERATPTTGRPRTHGRGRAGGCPAAAADASTGSPSRTPDPTPDRERTPDRGSATTGDMITFAPSPHIDVVATAGAGDAFAAGFLSATLRGLPVRDRLRHGHLMAAAVLTVPGDLGTPPSRDHADRLAALDDDVWERLRLGPGWTTQVAPAADREVRTP